MRTLNRTQLVTLIKEDAIIREILPWSDTLVNYHDNINKGCSCNRGKRDNATDNLYLDIIKNFLDHNTDVKAYMKEHLMEDQIEFTHGEEVILVI